MPTGRSRGSSDWACPRRIRRGSSRNSSRDLALRDRVQRRAVEIIQETAEQDLTSGLSPKIFAAAAVYRAPRLCDKHVPQKTVAASADVDEVTIRNRYHEQADALWIEC